MGQSTKLMITEDILLNAYYLELVCKSVYINAKVLHAGLSDAERVQLVKRFKDFKDNLMILVIMYQVFSQDVNHDPCCVRVIVFIPAINAPSKI